MTTEQTADHLKGVLKNMVCELVDHPEELDIQCTHTQGGTLLVFTVYPHPNEVGKVIGKSGRNAMAMRTLMESVAAKHGTKIILEIPDARKQRR